MPRNQPIKKKPLSFISCAGLALVAFCLCVFVSTVTNSGKTPPKATPTSRTESRSIELTLPTDPPVYTAIPSQTDAATSQPDPATATSSSTWTPAPILAATLPSTQVPVPTKPLPTWTIAPTKPLPTWTARPLPTWTPVVVRQATVPPAPPPPPHACCMKCTPGKSKACGDACIRISYNCTKPPGCACD